MNSRQLWNSYQRHKFLKVEVSRDILKFSLWNGIFRGFQEVFSTTDAMLICQNMHRTGNKAIKMSQAFHDITRFKHCTDLYLFKYALNVNQNWEMDGYFLLAVMVEGDESSRLRMANYPGGFDQLLALINSSEITRRVIGTVRQVHHLKFVLY